MCRLVVLAQQKKNLLDDKPVSFSIYWRGWTTSWKSLSCKTVSDTGSTWRPAVGIYRLLLHKLDTISLAKSFTKTAAVNEVEVKATDNKYFNKYYVCPFIVSMPWATIYTVNGHENEKPFYISSTCPNQDSESAACLLNSIFPAQPDEVEAWHLASQPTALG